ncbi:MAG: hypothetical protein GC202_00920 [Alphaproteobacteria bacterium]|nr:hypothetical protein [Alphaproteobacteria bacterium]
MKTRLVLTAFLALVPALAFAQALNLGRAGSGTPIEITARDGIEWDRDAQRYIANGDAVARQGENTVYGDRLVAWYRTAPGGGTEIYRYEALGNVRFATPTQTVEGDRGVYDVASDVVVVTGKALRLRTPTDTLTARDSLEYWSQRDIAVARGNAMVVSADRRMSADVMTAHFIQNQPAPAARQTAGTRNTRAGQRQSAAPAKAEDESDRKLSRIEAFGNVFVSTPTEIARGDRGIYNMQTGIAQLAGNVRLTRGDNQMAGDFAEVNTNTGISKLLARPAEGGNGRVRGLLAPQQAREEKKKKP